MGFVSCRVTADAICAVFIMVFIATALSMCVLGG